MKKVYIKAICLLLICMSLLFSSSSCILSALSSLTEKSYEEQLKEYYDNIKKSKGILDICCSDFYSKWSAAVWLGEYDGDVEKALYTVVLDHEDDIKNLGSLKNRITNLYDNLKDGEDSVSVKNVYAAYLAYYNFFIDPPGNLFTYSSRKDELKNSLQSALDNA